MTPQASDRLRPPNAEMGLRERRPIMATRSGTRCRWAATHRHRDQLDRMSQVPDGGEFATGVVARHSRSDTVVSTVRARTLNRDFEGVERERRT